MIANEKSGEKCLESKNESKEEKTENNICLDSEKNEIFDSDFSQISMELAFKQALMAKNANEVPVGCVFVDNKSKQVLASAHNQTRKYKNHTKHCEIVCIEYLCLKLKYKKMTDLHVYVTVEPCIMCASALAIMKIQKVFYGCQNTKFGGNGSVFSMNTKNAVGIPSSVFNDNYIGYSSVFVGQHLPKFKQQAIDILKTFYEIGNLSLPEYKRARNRQIKLKHK